VDVNLDDILEKFMGLNLPFLDFRVGVQGAREAFSFVVTREDEDYHSERNNVSKIIRMMRISNHKKHMIAAVPVGGPTARAKMQEVAQELDSLLESEPVVRFYGSEHWKISGYMSTLLPSFFLSMLTSLVDFAKDDVSFLLQEWLFIMQRINQQRTLTDACCLSLPAASKLLMKKDPCISAASKDIVMRPVLFALAGTDRLDAMVEEMSGIILDTYKRLKKEQSVRAAYGGSG
jgi:hypothetical protein